MRLRLNLDPLSRGAYLHVFSNRKRHLLNGCSSSLYVEYQPKRGTPHTSVRTRCSMDIEDDGWEGGRSGELGMTKEIDEVSLLFFRRSLGAVKRCQLVVSMFGSEND